jgi:two-component system response regulator RegA
MPEAELSRSVLVVEDDPVLRQRLARAFRDRGYDVREAGDHETALAAAREDAPEYAVVDLRMPGPSGIEVVRGLLALDPATVAVVLTGYGSIATAIEAVKAGAAHYLTKPANVDEIIAAFERGGRGPGEIAPDDEGTVTRPPLPPTLARVEWEHINRVLSDCGGNVSKAARLLGIHRRSLQRKLNKFPAPR